MSLRNTKRHSSPSQLSLRAEKQERLRIATELRDSTCEEIAALKMNLGVLKRLWNAPRSDILVVLQECLELAGQCEQELRIFAHLLYPPSLDEFRLATALHHYLAGLEKRTGVKVLLRVDLPSRMPKTVELMLFRIVQEYFADIQLESSSSDALHLLLCCPQDGAVMLETKCRERSRHRKKDASWRSYGNRNGMQVMRHLVQSLRGEFAVHVDREGVGLRVLMPLYPDS